MAIPNNEESEKALIRLFKTADLHKKMLADFDRNRMMSNLFKSERYEWSELKFYHRWYLKLLRRLPPLKPYKAPVSSGDVIKFKRPTPYKENNQ